MKTLFLAIALFGVVLPQAGCACWQPAHAQDKECVILHQVIDCTETAAATLGPVLAGVISAFVEQGNVSIDWSAIEAKLEAASSGVLPLPKNGESFVGGHAVLIVGYNKHKVIGSSTGAFLARNSWGADWGQKGNFWMPFDYVNHGLADDAWTLRRAEVSP